MVVWTWRTWADPIVDFGREVYVPWRLFEGDHLYRDVAYFNGPLSPYINLGVFRLLGPSVNSILMANYVCHILIATAICVLVNLLTSLRCGLLCVTVYQALFGFAQYESVANFNYLAPYSHELTHGMLLSLLCLLSMYRTLASRRGSWGLATGALLGLVFLTKPEPFLALAAACGTGLATTTICRPSQLKRVVQLCLAMLVGATIVIATAAILLRSNLSWHDAWQGMLGGWTHVFDKRITDLKFYRRGAGWDAPTARLMTIAFWLAIQLLALRFAWRESFRQKASEKKTVDLCLLILTVVLFYVVTVTFRTSIPLMAILVYSTLPVWVLCVIGGTLRQMRKPFPRGGLARRSIILACMVFALLMLAKIPLCGRISGYGFALAMPATLTVVSAAWWVAQQVAIRNGSVQRFCAWCIFFFLSFNVFYFVQMARLISARDAMVMVNNTPLFRACHERAVIINSTLAEIQARLKEEDTLAVWPEGALLNFLAQRRNSTPYIVLMPPEVLMYSEDVILDSYQRQPPDYVLLINRDTSEYGVGQFGHGYAQNLWAWLWQEYRPVTMPDQERSESDKFGMLLLKWDGSP